MDLLVRGIDRELHKRLKAKAALEGISVSRAVENAIRAWLAMGERSILSEMDANNEAYLRLKPRLLKESKGKYAIFCSGKFSGLANTLDEASKVVKRSGSARALVTKVGEEEPAGGEWLWSSLEL